MKIYCSCCDKVQPVRIDNCRDAKTHEPFQDIVCATCDLVIASGTDIQRKPLTDEEMRKLADKHLFYQPEVYEVSGVFTLARAIEAAHGIKEKNT